MRVVKISILIFCAVVFFAPQAVLAEETSTQDYSVMQQGTTPQIQPISSAVASNQTNATPRYYTSPNGITKHYTPEMQMQQQGVPYTQMNFLHKASRCPMCAKIRAAQLTQEQRMQLMMTLYEFSIQNQPMFDELTRLKQKHAELKRISTTPPEVLATIEIKRENVRCALMKNLKKQRAILKRRFCLDITEREMLLHKLQEMKSGQPMQKSTKRMPKGYRSPQQSNSNYNQNYLLNAPMREGTSPVQTY
ncbi:hypothetical protein ACQ0P8_15440 [Halodesulfovibrio aestuarii]|uniref:Periplasmic heavy metal sensor n=1 Tax=Halodesulfovibrio aestuarii TaxID=126333 RepID=A0A8G2CB51_9BACT|nr:hypothetical protein [Halodesulfovibrio aestuarii]SHJ47173.1 hypothetical protein SAMN05660830_02515 [Halodesulfovibrio aestuarii]